MNISSFTRMRAYRKCGRLSLILKLSLPRIEAEARGYDAFNNFYIGIAEKYLSLLENYNSKIIGSTRPVKVSADYSVITDEYMKKQSKKAPKLANAVVIKRTVSINNDGYIKRGEYIDIYDENIGCFIK